MPTAGAPAKYGLYGSFHDGQLGELEHQLLLPNALEEDRSLAGVAAAFDTQHLAYAEFLVLPIWAGVLGMVAVRSFWTGWAFC